MNLLSRVGHDRFNRTPIDQLLEEDFSYEDCWNDKDTAILSVCYVTPEGKYGSVQRVKRDQLKGRDYQLRRCVGVPHICIDVHDAGFDRKAWKVINPL